MRDPERTARLYRLTAPTRALSALADLRAYVLGAANLPLLVGALPQQVLDELRGCVGALLEEMRGRDAKTVPTRWAALARREMAARMSRIQR